jgi:gliding motility-associated-like protein
MRIVLILSIVLLTAIFQGLEARHIIGGDMSYKCTEIDTVNKRFKIRITLKMYRDCYSGGADYDDQIELGVYEKLPNGTFLNQTKFVVSLGPVNRIDPDSDNPCLILPPTVCVEEGTYEYQSSWLDMKNNSYYFAYQRCCRNESITNIRNPGDDGAAFVIEMTPEAQRICNNSPVFKNFPPVVICVNTPLSFDHSVIDTEGDSVSYEFCDPLIAGGQNMTQNGMSNCDGVRPDPQFCRPPFKTVVFKSPYNTSFPLNGNPRVIINSRTGLITGTPNIIGQFVVGVCIKEFRNQILLTETRRDFQFNVAFCEPKVFAKLESDSVLNGADFVINSCGNNTVDFKNLSTNENFISSYEWIFNIKGKLDTITTKNASITFPGFGSYTGKMILNKGTACSDSANILVNIFPGIHAAYSFSYDTCIAGPVAFRDSSVSGSGMITQWNWNFSYEGYSILKDPDFVFPTPGNKQVQLQVTDINLCKDDTTVVIPFFPVPSLLIVNPSSVTGCTPLKVCFNNLSIPIDSTYKLLWDFGDGQTATSISPCHEYQNEGLFSVRLEVTSPIGCFTSIDYPGLIDVRKSPEADFSITPEMLTSLRKTARFQDLSQFSTSREWLLNDLDRFQTPGFDFTFRDTGVQKIRLIAISSNGCTDTLIKYIDIEPRVTFYVPNAFTPNEDTQNDEFLGKGILEGMKNFRMTIWDRWGMELFMTSNPRQGWNGKLNNTGRDVPNGVYVFKVDYLTPRDKAVEIKGFVQVLR